MVGLRGIVAGGRIAGTRPERRTIPPRLGSVVDDELCSGHDAGAIAAALAELGHLRRGGDGKAQRTERLPGIGPRRVYVLRASILGEGADDA